MNDLTRRDALRIAAASVVPTGLKAENNSSSICFMSTVEMARLIRAKKLSAREALAEHLKQIERINPKVNAIVTLAAEMATDAAAKADEMQARKQKLGVLHGLPVAHKDTVVRCRPPTPAHIRDSRHPHYIRFAALQRLCPD